MKRFTYAVLAFMSWGLIVVLFAIPENKYDWMQEMSENTNLTLPVDDDSMVAVHAVSIIIVMLSLSTLFFKNIPKEIRIPLCIVPCLGVLLKYIL